VVDIQVSWAERLVRFLSHPVVAPFLLSLGFLGLIVEVKTPTLGLAGGAGLLALSLFFGSHLILGLAGWEDLLVFGGGVVLLAVEVIVIPGFGLFGIAGIVAVLAGLYMSMLGNLPTMQDFGRAGGVLSTTLLIVLISAWALLRYLPKSGRLFRSGVFLGSATDRDEGYQAALARPELVGTIGKAITDLRPSGVGLFGDERIDIVSQSEWIEEGTVVEIVADEGYRHVVRATREQLNEDASG
jgi:membrane-bound serine protease (ClpP class)